VEQRRIAAIRVEGRRLLELRVGISAPTTNRVTRQPSNRPRTGGAIPSSAARVAATCSHSAVDLEQVGVAAGEPNDETLAVDSMT